MHNTQSMQSDSPQLEVVRRAETNKVILHTYKWNRQLTSRNEDIHFNNSILNFKL